MEGLPICGLLWMLGLTAVNALVEAMVTAFENTSEAGVEKKAEDGDETSKKVLYLLEHHRRYITVTDLLRILAMAGITLSYTIGVLPAIKQWITTDITTQSALVILIIVLVSLLAVMLVELFGIKLPKKIAFKHAEGFSYSLVGLLRLLTRVLAPVSWVLETVTIGILKLFHIKASELEETVTEEELIYSVTEAQESGVLEAEEAEMIHNIFEFDDKEVKDIMTHRTAMIAVDAEWSLTEAMRFMMQEAYSRFPVYEDSVENIIGILHMKDVMRLYVSGKPEKLQARKVKSIARKPYFIPDTQSLDVLFRAMQKKKIHMAIAIDEYGQTAGLITMEDILEEIVGDIQDEYDSEEADIQEQPDGSYLVKGITTLEDLSETLEMDITSEEFDTLNGLLTAELNHIPSENERATICYNGLEMDILEVKNKMITLVRVAKLPEEEEAEEVKEEE